MNKDLDIWEILIIRLCKRQRRSVGLFKRILAKRNRVNKEAISDIFLVDFLSDIVERYNLGGGLNRILVNIAERGEWWKTPIEDNMKLKNDTLSYIFAELTTIIMMTHPDKDFLNYPMPSWFKNKVVELSTRSQ